MEKKNFLKHFPRRNKFFHQFFPIDCTFHYTKFPDFIWISVPFSKSVQKPLFHTLHHRWMQATFLLPASNSFLFLLSNFAQMDHPLRLRKKSSFASKFTIHDPQTSTLLQNLIQILGKSSINPTSSPIDLSPENHSNPPLLSIKNSTEQLPASSLCCHCTGMHLCVLPGIRTSKTREGCPFFAGE